MPIPEVVSVARAKAHLSELLKEAKEGRLFEIINRSEAVAIVMDVERYRTLLATIEDLEDTVAVLEGRLEDRGQPPMPWEQVVEEYGKAHPETDV
jgi:prevent-host-death family protein